jgi:hypothetical protein
MSMPASSELRAADRNTATKTATAAITSFRRSRTAGDHLAPWDAWITPSTIWTR